MPTTGCNPFLALLRGLIKMRDRIWLFLKALATTNEGRSEIGGLFVLGGLVLEVWLAFKFRSPDKSFSEEWGPIIADIFVAGGVFTELYFGRKASDESAERVSQANERAAAAELQTEKLKAQFAWRRLSASQAAAISRFIEGKPKSCLQISYTANDPEANIFARDIGAVFSGHGWPVGFVAQSSGQIIFGLRIPILATYSQHVDLATSCMMVHKAFSEAGIEHSGQAPPTEGMSMGSGDEITYPCPTIYVGSKPIAAAE
jgi:hypothetical protein